MSKIIDAVVGDGKTATPAKKYVVYAGIVTFVALVAAIAVLVVSSILFAVRDKAPEEPAVEVRGAEYEVLHLLFILQNRRNKHENCFGRQSEQR